MYHKHVTLLMIFIVFCLVIQTVAFGGEDMTITIKSSAFEPHGRIPSKYTCDGEDLSPPLDWSGVPARARSLVLICDDPDAPMGTWVHWVLYNVPASTSALDEGVLSDALLSNGAIHGMTDFRRLGYGGPCPPAGTTHRYFFKIYALDTVLALEPGLSKGDIEKAMDGHILASGELVGIYKRQE